MLKKDNDWWKFYCKNAENISEDFAKIILKIPYRYQEIIKKQNDFTQL